VADKSILKKKHITIREYVPEDQDRLITLLNAPSIKTDIWRWQFDNRYFSSDAKPIVAEDNWGNLLGFNGLMPIKLYTHSSGDLDAAWSCDFFVSRQCRGLGVGKEIKRELKKQSPITFALGTSETAAKVLEQSGWHRYKEFYDYTYRNQANSLDAQSSTASISISDALPAPHMVNTLWKSCASSYNAIVRRDHSYLNWRYEKSPIARYRYLKYVKDNSLISITILQVSDSKVSIIDYLGPSQHQEDKIDVINYLKRNNRLIQCGTSSMPWKIALEINEFQRNEKPSNCFIYAENNQHANEITQDFFLMKGDCDGDILRSSVESARIQDKAQLAHTHCTEISYEHFLNMRQEWESLLSKSKVNSLFLSWDWINTWWLTFAEKNKFKFRLIACFMNEQLIGLAPLYERSYRLYWLPVKQLQLIGCSWSGPNTFRSEYLDFITDMQHQRTASNALLDYMYNKLKWDELVLGDIPHESMTTRLIEESYRSYSYARTVHGDQSVQVPCNLDRKLYIQKLSANFRRVTIHKYKQFQSETSCTVTNYSNPNDYDFNLIDELNALHIPRWGKSCFEGINREFHEKLIRLFGATNRLNVCTMKVDKTIVGLSYNLVHIDKVYNIQLGFDQKRYPSYSLGLMQLCQNILGIIETKSFKAFDLLAGYGKTEYYKARFGGRHQQIITRQYLRTKWLIILYKIYDKKPHKKLLKLSR